MADSQVAQPISVLHVFTYFRPDFTGEGIYLEKLAEHLNRLSIEGDVIVYATRAPAHTAATGHVRSIKYFGSGGRAFLQLNWPMTIWFARNVRCYDVVHFHSWISRYFQFHLLAKLLNRKVVHSCTLDDGLGRIVQGYRAAYRPIVRWLTRLIDLTIAISPKLYDDCLRVAPTGRVTLIPQGVNIPTMDTRQRASARAHLGYEDSDAVLLYVGGICARKDVEFLIDQHTAASDGNVRVKLLIVGPDLEDEYAGNLRRKVASMQNAASIQFMGHLSDPTMAYRAADAFVFASRSEGFGNVMIEAMSFALPIVCRHLPGVTDHIVQNRRNGCLFETAAEYCEIVRNLLADHKLRHDLGTAARDTVISRFSLPKITDHYAEIYRRLAPSRRNLMKNP